MNIRHGIAAAALLATAALTTACATPTAGTASSAAGAVISTSASSAPATTTASSSSSSSSSSSTSSSTSSPESSEEDPVTIEVPNGSNVPELDATTAIWLQNSCTDVETLLAALFTYPTVDETAPLEDFRTAYRDYYAGVSDTVLGITERMAQLDAPTIDGGQDLHDGYLNYLIDLADITGGGAIAIDAATDAATIQAVIDQIDVEIEQLGQSDYGLADFQSAELQELMSQVPACDSLLNS